MRYIFSILLFLSIIVTKVNAQYCPSTSVGSCYHYLGQVVMGSINQTTACANYTSFYVDWTASSTTIVQGASDNITLSNTSSYTTYYRVWVDWNQDFDFIDAGENVIVSGPIASGSSYVGSITCPLASVVGNTRMRIKADYYNGFGGGSCSGGTEVETQDYTLQILGLGTTPTSGQVNIYSSVSNICQNEFTVSSTAGFNVGDKVLLIQMRGASADLSNTAVFGNITGLNNAGKYEFLTVSSIAGATISTNELPQFNYTVSGNVQLVKVAVYTTASTILGSITCPAWDGVTGGVIVIESPNTIVINGNISADGRGFRGGAPDNAAWGCNNPASYGYFYVQTSTYSAPKGEGISSQLINAGNTEGRGKIANGGGAGNNVNAGGGGGGNGNTGGIGGFQWISCSDPTPAFTQGLPGLSLASYYSNANNIIFMGGGGGGGHAGANVAGGGAGANGGGIIIIKANTIDGTGSITARGNNAVNNSGQWAGGGGGAGGTALLTYTTAIGNISINTNGGSGGNAWWPNELGPGGGGSGGILWLSGGGIPLGYTYTTTGGVNGVWVTGGTAFGAMPGSSGPAPIANLNMPPLSVLPMVPCSPLAVEWLNFDATLIHQHLVELNWTTSSEINSDEFIIERAEDGINYQEIGRVNAIGNSNTYHTYQFADYDPWMGTSYYRLKEIEFNGNISNSEIRVVENNGEESILIFPNPANDFIQINFPGSMMEEELIIPLFDAAGKTIYILQKKKSVTNVVVPVGTIPNGVYYIRINQEHFKLIISH